LHEDMALALEDGTVTVNGRPTRHSTRRCTVHAHARRQHGRGVTNGFAKSLEIQGVGYKAEPKPFGVQLVVDSRIPSLPRAAGNQDYGDE